MLTHASLKNTSEYIQLSKVLLIRFEESVMVENTVNRKRETQIGICSYFKVRNGERTL